MKKKEQALLIEKVIKSPKSNQDCKEFKQLQMHWYSKLEKLTDYEDIERTGLQRSKYYDEYNGNIKNYSWSITDKYDFFTHAYYQKLRYFSWHAIVTSTSPIFDASKPYKSHKINKISLISDSNPSSSTNNTIKTQKLSVVDAKILYMIGDGSTITDISLFLRRYLSHHASASKRGPKGKPFSIYYVHSRLDKLIQSIQAGTIYIADEGGEVKKTGLE